MSKALAALYAILCLFLAVCLSDAHAADRVDFLLKLLQKKGIITAEEAEALDRELAEATGKEDAVPPPVQPVREELLTQGSRPEQTGDTTATEARVELGWDGLWVRTRDDNFAFRIAASLMADFRYFGIEKPQYDLFDIRRARLGVEGWLFKDFHFEIEADFEGAAEPKLRDGYLEWIHFPWARFRAGQYKQPFTMEYMTSLRYLPFLERSFIRSLVHGRDVGAEVYGTLKDESLTYWFSVVNGLGLDRGLDSSGSKDIVGRGVLRPFFWSKHALLRELRVGGSIAFGRIQPLDLRDFEILTTGMTPIFRLSSGGKFGLIIDSKTRFKQALEGSWVVASLLLQAEWARLELEGLAGWLVKPPTPDHLAGMIASVLRSHRSTEKD